MQNIKLFTAFSMLFLTLAGSTFAQRPSEKFDQEKLQSARVAFITTRLDLKPEQAELFWPIYNQYTDQREKNLREISTLTRTKDEAPLTESEAKQRLSQKLELQRKLIAEEEKLIDDLAKVITYNQIIKLNNIGRDFTRQIYQRQRRQ